MTITRRLAAILAADVAGYSRLMGADEVGTLEALKAHRREVVDPLIAANHGRIVKTTGDGMLAEFASAVDAVTCAMSVQKQMAERGGQIQFRIGINIGDIISEGDDIFGDGVNVAARVENECEPGGVYLSDDAHRQVVGKLKFAFQDLGERTLKNITRPVRLYAARLGAAQASNPSLALGDGEALPLPDKPSIAVLPFQNMSGDPDQEYFADGMVEDIVTALSRFKSLFVIARNSSFTYKDKSVDVKQVARELGVRYVLEGSVRKTANRLRITGQLIEAATSVHLWADKFDGALEDVFELQDRVTAEVVGEIGPKLEEAEIERVLQKRSAKLEGYDLYLKALAQMDLRSMAGHRPALAFDYQAIDADPNYAAPYGHAAMIYSDLNDSALLADRSREKTEALRLANRALAICKDDAETIARAGMAIGVLGTDRERGLALAAQALTINPNLAFGWGLSGWLHIYNGSPQIGLEHCGTALRLSPTEARRSVRQLGIATAHLLLGDHDAALVWAKKPYFDGIVSTVFARMLAVCAGYKGELALAKVAIAAMQRNEPDVSVAKVAKHYKDVGYWARHQDVEVILKGLRLAGLPE